MDVLLAITVGMLYASGMYMMLRRSIVKLIIGLILLSHAANLLIFIISRITRGKPPLIPEGETFIRGDFADPVPQALILTAIVISFGVQAFAIVLLKKVYQKTQTDDLDQLNTTDTEEIEIVE
ncbi:MAG: Na+/H+ antiporter subunit C [Bacteroidetes bacterium]|nr:Na+/H+ antiporter subunit C [Bacteroidota bacterium]